MSKNSYGQFCPVAMACDVLGQRWTLLILRELLLGSHHFNEIRKGLPKISPTLLAKRLQDLTDQGILEKRPSNNGVMSCYQLTQSGRNIQPIIVALGLWGREHFEFEAVIQKSEPHLLMWDLKRNINLDQLPKRNLIIQFEFPEQPKRISNWWVCYKQELGLDVGHIDPGNDIDLLIKTSVHTLTEIHMGSLPSANALSSGRLNIEGSRDLSETMDSWLGTNALSFAKIASR